MPKSSIIITTHSRPRLVPRAAQSARASGADIEVVVVDDASTDETAEVCASLPWVRYVRLERNQGVAGARKVGLLAARGRFVSFLDDDDARLPGTLDRQVELLEAAPRAALIYGQALVADQDFVTTGRLYPRECPEGDVFWKLLTQNFIPCGSAVFRRSALFGAGLPDESIAGIDDWDLWVRIAELHDVIALREPVIIWRQSTPASAQGTSQAAGVVSLCTRQFRRRWMRLPRAASASTDERRAAWANFSENMAAHLIWQTARALRRGSLRRAGRNACAVVGGHLSGAAHVALNRAGRKLRRGVSGDWPRGGV